MRDRAPLRKTFGGTAAYLNMAAVADEWDPFTYIPEMSWWFRGLVGWWPLRAVGRQRDEAIVARSLANAKQLADWVATRLDLELMASPYLNMVCFRVSDEVRDAPGNDTPTNAVVTATQSRNAAYVTGTRSVGLVAIRAAFDNWLTTADDVVVLQQAVSDAATGGQ